MVAGDTVIADRDNPENVLAMQNAVPYLCYLYATGDSTASDMLAVVASTNAVKRLTELFRKTGMIRVSRKEYPSGKICTYISITEQGRKTAAHLIEAEDLIYESYLKLTESK